VIGLPLYNRAEYLTEALESLLSQTYRDFALVAADDCSTDDTPEVMQRYQFVGNQLTYRRNDTRVGMVQNWRQVFELGRELYPTAEYFAWASDHDVWHPRWLSALVAEIDRYPDVAMVYPLSARIGASGEVIGLPRAFDMFGIVGRYERLRLACRGLPANQMVYGLFRATSLVRAGIFRPVLQPDRLLLTEMVLDAQFKQVPEVLWFRRFSVLVTEERQRASFFPNGNPAYSYLPAPVTHAAVLWWDRVLPGPQLSALQRIEGIWCTLAFAYWTVAHLLSMRWRRGRKAALGALQPYRKQFGAWLGKSAQLRAIRARVREVS
jgi:glycosyltransferase involved in cell wall biosynthesis